jgi:hypothetical protein
MIEMTTKRSDTYTAVQVANQQGDRVTLAGRQRRHARH